MCIYNLVSIKTDLLNNYSHLFFLSVLLYYGVYCLGQSITKDDVAFQKASKIVTY